MNKLEMTGTLGHNSNITQNFRNKYSSSINIQPRKKNIHASYRALILKPQQPGRSQFKTKGAFMYIIGVEQGKTKENKEQIL